MAGPRSAGKKAVRVAKKTLRKAARVGRAVVKDQKTQAKRTRTALYKIVRPKPRTENPISKRSGRGSRKGGRLRHVEGSLFKGTAKTATAMYTGRTPSASKRSRITRSRRKNPKSKR